MISGISNRLRVSTLDVRYLHSLTGVCTRCPVSPIDYGCLHSISDISSGLWVSTLDVRYRQSITGSTLDVRYLHSITNVYTRCPVSPLYYECRHSMSGISIRLRMSTIDARYLQSITSVFTRYGFPYSITYVYILYPVSQLDYRCLHPMSLSEIKGFRDTGSSDNHTLTCGRRKI